jgi:hypothetical protein
MLLLVEIQWLLGSGEDRNSTRFICAFRLNESMNVWEVGHNLVPALGPSMIYCVSPLINPLLILHFRWYVGLYLWGCHSNHLVPCVFRLISSDLQDQKICTPVLVTENNVRRAYLSGLETIQHGVSQTTVQSPYIFFFAKFIYDSFLP